MNSAYNVIIRPIVSERSYDLMEQGNYTFEVAKTAGKEEIAEAVEKLFGVHVVKVNTMSVKGKHNIFHCHGVADTTGSGYGIPRFYFYGNLYYCADWKAVFVGYFAHVANNSTARNIAVKYCNFLW
jgi:ribosomal protein L23